MNRKSEKVKTYRGWLVTAFAVIMLMILLEAVYYIYHIQDNRENVLAAYKSDQSQETALLAMHIDGMSESDMISNIKKAVSVSGSEWVFLIRGDKIIFVRDDMTTSELSHMTAGELVEYMDTQNGMISESRVSDSDYTVGLFAEKSYVLSSYGVNDFEFYIIIAVIAVLLVFGGMIIEYAGRIGHMGRKVRRLEDELAERNEKFDEYEKLTDRYEEELRQKDSGNSEKNASRYYDMEVVDSLLSKSSDPMLYPITFMFISVQMGDRYFSRDEIFRIMDFIKGCMGPNHVTAEMTKGNFVVLMYKTDMAAAEAIKTDMLERWKNISANAAGAEIKTKLIAVKNGDDPRQVFEQEGMNG